MGGDVRLQRRGGGGAIGDVELQDAGAAPRRSDACRDLLGLLAPRA